MRTFIDLTSKDVSLVFSVSELITLRKILSYGVCAISDELDLNFPDDASTHNRLMEPYRSLSRYLDDSTEELVKDYSVLS